VDCPRFPEKVKRSWFNRQVRSSFKLQPGSSYTLQRGSLSRLQPVRGARFSFQGDLSRADPRPTR